MMAKLGHGLGPQLTMSSCKALGLKWHAAFYMWQLLRFVLGGSTDMR
jgi:hypothetical protein